MKIAAKTGKLLLLVNSDIVTYLNHSTIEIEYVHLRGAMFGFYKKGSIPPDHTGRLPDKGLQLMKPGKLMNLIGMKNAYTDADIEKIVNKIKGRVSVYGDENGEHKQENLFSIVQGAMIGWYYLEQNYVPIEEGDSNLSGSCMRYESCLPMFQVYEENHDIIKMVVLRNNENLIIARALLWCVDGEVFMDTIYHATDVVRDQMVQFACSQGWYYKSRQSCHFFAFDMRNGAHVEPKIITVELKAEESWKMPWLDTMRIAYWNDDKLVLTNCISGRNASDNYTTMYRSTSGPEASKTRGRTIDTEVFPKYSEASFHILYNRLEYPAHISDLINDNAGLAKVKANVEAAMGSGETEWWRSNSAHSIINDSDLCRGSAYMRAANVIEEDDDDEDEDDMYYVPTRGESYDEDDVVWCERRSEWLHVEDAEEVNGEWYYTEDGSVAWVSTRDRYYLSDDTCWCEYREEAILDRDAIYVEDYGYVYDGDIDKVAVVVDGTWVRKDECIKCEISGVWILIEDAWTLPDGRMVCAEEYDKVKETEEEDQP